LVHSVTFNSTLITFCYIIRQIHPKDTQDRVESEHTLGLFDWQANFNHFQTPAAAQLGNHQRQPYPFRES
jgi:hypothetical protein